MPHGKAGIPAINTPFWSSWHLTIILKKEKEKGRKGKRGDRYPENPSLRMPLRGNSI